jgi:hypothetical protein
MTPEIRLLREIFGDTDFEDPPPRRPPNTKPLFRLAAVVPEFTDELSHLLSEQGEIALAACVPDLQVYDRCPCEGDFCATMYTQPIPEAAFPGRGGVSVLSKAGPVYIDTSYGMIACIEVLDQPEIRRKLVAALP